ncbi:hypothetical protein [Ruegeria sp. HKCCA5014]|uniref:hypothetical protein n=1 Tax=Ruegeria sp. HKCCA5014 TaxID=2682980 RepID=UPI00147B4356|nr:hypothetical protein [Ruegeria sp. HKCCA5014]
MNNLMQTTDVSFIERESSAAEISHATTTARMDTLAEYMRSAMIFDQRTLVVPFEELDFDSVKPV